MSFDPDKVETFYAYTSASRPTLCVRKFDYDRLLSLYKEVTCFKCTRSSQIDAYGMCHKHKLRAYPTT